MTGFDLKVFVRTLLDDVVAWEGRVCRGATDGRSREAETGSTLEVRRVRVSCSGGVKEVDLRPVKPGRDDGRDGGTVVAGVFTLLHEHVVAGMGRPSRSWTHLGLCPDREWTDVEILSRAHLAVLSDGDGGPRSGTGFWQRLREEKNPSIACELAWAELERVPLVSMEVDQELHFRASVHRVKNDGERVPWAKLEAWRNELEERAMRRRAQ